MRSSRLHTGQPLAAGETVVLEDSRAHYLGRVLRLGPGDPVWLFNGDGHDYAGEIVRCDRGGAEIALTGREAVANESPLAITLVQAISRGERMDHTVQKATELGVARIQPLFSRRVEVKLSGQRLERRLAHWQEVAISACEQAGRARVPEVLPPLSLQQWIDTAPDAVRLVLHPDAPGALAALVGPLAALSVVVGPEGGFEEAEIGALIAAGVQPVTLGPRVLRTETAGMAAIAVLQAAHGDFAPNG